MLGTSELGHILIVDDDTNITELLRVNLSSMRYSVEVIDRASDVDRGDQGHTRLVIVDAMQQQYSGMDLIRDFKDDPRTEQIAIILYSAFRGESMVIEALDAGADDYLVKPFSLREMIARVKSVLRRHERSVSGSAGGNVIAFQNMSVSLITQTVKIGQEPVALTKTEYSLLVLLLKNRDNYVSRAEILSKVWKDDVSGGNERVVDTNISRLRKKLGELGARIVNRSGHGYMIS